MIHDKITKYGSRLLLLFLLFLTISIVVVQRDAMAAKKENVKVGCFPLNGYCDFALNGHVSGYGIEYSDTICNIAGYNVQHVKYNSWVEALEGLRKGEIDILGPAEKTKEREEEFDFAAFQAGIEYGSILTSSTTNNLLYEDFNSFQGLNVGCVKSLVFYDDFLKYEKLNNFNCNLTFYNDTPELLNALSVGEVQAIVANLMVKTDSMKMLARFGAAPYYLMISRRKEGLTEKLNEAMEKQNSQHPEFLNNLQNKYFKAISRTPFTKSELDFIGAEDTIKVALPSNYMPFSYIDNSKKVAGVDQAIFEQISKISGLHFEYITIPEGIDYVEFMTKNNIQLLSGIETGESSINIKGVTLSDPIYEISKSFIGSENVDFSISKNMSVATVHMTESQLRYWKLKYLAFSFHEYDSEADCIDAVRSGKADIILSNRYSIENFLDQPWNSDLSFIPTVATTAQICVGVNNSFEWYSSLLDIINKSIAMITDENIETYLSTYAQDTRYKYDFYDFLYVYRVQIVALILMLILIITGVIIFIRSRRKVQHEIAHNLARQLELTERLGIENKRIELILDKVEEVFFEVLSNGKVLVSPSFKDKFGWSSPERVKINENVAQQILRIMPDDIPKADEAVETLINTIIRETHIKNMYWKPHSLTD